MQFNLSDPVSHVIKALLVSTIISENDAHCTFVIGLSDSSEAFLTSGVPNLKLYIFSINLNRLDLEIDS